MKQVAIREFVRGYKRHLRALAPGDKLAVTCDGQVMFEVAKPTVPNRTSHPDFAGKLREIFGTRQCDRLVEGVTREGLS